ncbi:uncharacterized protein E6C27_scaffold68G00020 [Cucumis melo var. makuwa]|uniref:Uncharacterized protein n=1 Tax=Cucumis melo var. makuwa TaxID=1194695 RepID=A0A5A7T1N0_CUCMM|nr:uncharacterized protein E6C27_scaffold68G00020 [Cucumis melo var. makuwa]
MPKTRFRSYRSACCTCSGTCQFLGEGKGRGKLASDKEGSVTCHMGTQFCFRVYEKVLENVVKEKKGNATSVPPVSLTSKKKVVEEEEMKEEEVIATRPMTKNEVKASRPMTKEVEVTSEPLNLPIQLKYLYSLIIDLKKVSKYAFVDPSLISAGHSTQEIKARNLCSRLMTSKQDQLVVAPYNHGALTIFKSQKNLKKTRKTTFWKAIKCPLQVGTVECEYYVM